MRYLACSCSTSGSIATSARRNMRITFLTQWFHPEPGALRGLPLASWLTARGHNVQVLTGFPNYPGGRVYPGYRQRLCQREEIENVRVLRLPLYPSHGQSAIGRVANYATFALSAAAIGSRLLEESDLLYVYHPPPTVGLPALLWKRTRSLPFVYHIADMWPESVLASGMVSSKRLARFVDLAISSWCSTLYKHASLITVLSPGFKQLLVERSVPAEKIHVLYNWADESIFLPQPPDSELASRLGMAGRFNVVYAGNLGPLQALDTAIRAAHRVEHLQDFQLVLVGTGQEEGRLRNLAASLGANNVLFLGRRPYEEMGRINALADVLLVSLRDLPFFRATIPSKLQVSLASGRPVLVAVAGDASRVIAESAAGLTCRPEDESALAAAFETMHGFDEATLAAMGSRGRLCYERDFSLASSGLKMERLFQAVAHNTPA